MNKAAAPLLRRHEFFHHALSREFPAHQVEQAENGFPVNRKVNIVSLRQALEGMSRGARQRLDGEEAREDVTQTQQIVRQMRTELEELLKSMRR